jgi:transposase InsO family protein
MSLNPSEKLEIINLIEGSPKGAKQTLRELGVSRSSFYKWYRRYNEHGIEGLASRKRVPKIIWNRIPESERAKVVKTALAYPEKSCREIACLVTDKEGYYVSESSVYRILKAKGLVQSPVFAIIEAKDKFDQPTIRINQLWQMDFTYFKVEIWGWYYLLTILDDFSRYILAWKLCTSMETDEVKAVLRIALEKTKMENVPLIWHPGLLSDHGSSFVSASLREFVEENDMFHIHGRPYHPQTQGKIERYHRSMKNIILLDKYYQPSELEYRIGEWVEYYNNRRYHESIGNVTPADKYFGRAEEVILARERIRMTTMRMRRTEYRRLLTCA